MKAKFVLLVSLCCVSVSCLAQPGSWHWTRNYGGVSLGTATDSRGNVYVTGYFTDVTTTFDSIIVENAQSGLGDIFVVKYDSSGKVIWAKGFGGTNIDKGKAITVDRNDDVYVTGQFASSSITFGDTTFTNPDLNPDIETYEYFIVKLDSFGNVLWARSASGTSVEHGDNLETDENGDVYVQGFFLSPTLQVESVTILGSGLGSIFLIKYDSHGTLLWVKILEGVGNHDPVFAAGMVFTGSDHIYLTGTFISDSFLAQDFLVESKYNDQVQVGDIYLIKYDLDGNVLWAKSFGGNDLDVSYGIDTDASGMIYITGSFISDTLTIGNHLVYNPRQSFGNDTDIFIAKIDPNGNALWARHAGGRSFDKGYDIAADHDGNLFITGACFVGGKPEEHVYFGSHVITEVSPRTTHFVAQYDSAGFALWVSSLDFDPASQGHEVSIDVADNVLITGATGYPNNFGNLELPVQSSSFLAKFNSCNNPDYEINNPIVLCEGDTTVLTSASATHNLWNTGSIQQSISVNTAGNYSVIISGLNSCPLIVSSTEVIVNPLPQATIEASDEFFCEGGSVIITASAAEQYEWSNGATTQSIVVSNAGNYSVIVTDVNGCRASSDQLPIEQHQPPAEVEVFADCDRLFVNNNLPVMWFKDGSAFGSNGQEIFPLDSGVYHVESTNICGTVRSNVIRFKPAEVRFLFVPNVITPDGDSFNEHFILDEKLTGAALLIFNRWGDDVYTSNRYENDWSGGDLGSGIYYYTIRHDCFKEKLKGIVQIIR